MFLFFNKNNLCYYKNFWFLFLVDSCFFLYKNFLQEYLTRNKNYEKSYKNIKQEFLQKQESTTQKISYKNMEQEWFLYTRIKKCKKILVDSCFASTRIFTRTFWFLYTRIRIKSSYGFLFCLYKNVDKNVLILVFLQELRTFCGQNLESWLSPKVNV